MMALRRCLVVLAAAALYLLTFAGEIVSMQYYDEPYRPQYHFSPETGWLNDPNGLVYFEGEYHLFYQYDPYSLMGGPKHWGHAVSADLIHWTHLPVALAPDELGAIWSGGAVADVNNTSGLVPGGGLAALYSYENQAQGAAFSADKGRTWTKYDGNPILPAVAKDFRDPKVFWHDNQWVMVIAAGDRLQIYQSANLLDWQLASEFGADIQAGLWEVPDLFPLTIDDEEKWVMLASVSNSPAGAPGVRYWIGDFDGTTFTADTRGIPLWLDYGPDNYAGTTWNDAPDGRRIYIGWMSNWPYGTAVPTSPWRGAMTLPRELTLARTSAGLRLMQKPVSEVAQLRGEARHWADVMVAPGNDLLDGVRGDQLEIIAEFELGSARVFGLRVLAHEEHFTNVVYDTRSGSVSVSRLSSGSTPVNEAFAGVYLAALQPVDNRVKLHVFVDRSSVEVFGHDGQAVISAQVFPDAGSDRLELFVSDGEVRLISLVVYQMQGIWK
jgi:fructan beta-fructosidase